MKSGRVRCRIAPGLRDFPSNAAGLICSARLHGGTCSLAFVADQFHHWTLRTTGIVIDFAGFAYSMRLMSA